MVNEKLLKIVHADDYPDVTQALADQCKGSPIEIYQAIHGQQAYDLVKEHGLEAIDIVVTDFDMGYDRKNHCKYMNGGELVDKLRDNGYQGVIITFNGVPRDFEPQISAGKVNHSIQKDGGGGWDPKIREVVQIIKGYLTRQNGN